MGKDGGPAGAAAAGAAAGQAAAAVAQAALGRRRRLGAASRHHRRQAHRQRRGCALSGSLASSGFFEPLLAELASSGLGPLRSPLPLSPWLVCKSFVLQVTVLCTVLWIE